MTTGEQLKLDGMAASMAAATNGHHDHGLVIRSAMHVLALRGQPFAACDVKELLPPYTLDHLKGSPGLMGSMFHHMRREKVIVQIGMVRPLSKSRHGNLNGQWIGIHALEAVA